MVNVAQKWAEVYTSENPDISVQVSGGGSGVGIAGLMDGELDMANASRAIKDEEQELVKKNLGQDPLEHVVGRDALAVYVHKDNPLNKISLAQLAAIYGESGDITKWSQLGIKVEGDDEIVRVSRQNSSGAYVYFRFGQHHCIGNRLQRHGLCHRPGQDAGHLKSRRRCGGAHRRKCREW